MLWSGVAEGYRVPCFDPFLPLQQITILSSSIVEGGGGGGGDDNNNNNNNNNNKRNCKCDHAQLLSSKERNQAS